MELINRAEKYKIINFDEIATTLICIFKPLAPDSLDKIIITPNDNQKYRNIIGEYTNDTSITNDNFSEGVAISINQFIYNKLKQIIFVKEEIFVKAFLSSNSKDTINSLDNSLCAGVIYHEIGHANDDYQRYKYYNIKPSNINQCNIVRRLSRHFLKYFKNILIVFPLFSLHQQKHYSKCSEFYPFS